MQIVTKHDALALLCKLSGKWGMYVNFHIPEEGDWWGELLKAAPWVKWGPGPVDDNTGQLLADGDGILLFDSREEMEGVYDQTIGDDGPTRVNPYNGPARVYALTCDPTGQLLNENT